MIKQQVQGIIMGKKARDAQTRYNHQTQGTRRKENLWSGENFLTVHTVLLLIMTS